MTARNRSGSKRERTRQQLIDAGMVLLADNRLAEASILDLATAAGVSNGTFYNYFQTREELLEAVAAQVSEQIALQLRQEFTGVDDPAERIVIAARTFMLRCHREPVFGWALVRLVGTLPQLSNTVRRSVLKDVRDGIANGRFRVQSEAAAADLVLGTLVLGIRSLLEGRESLAHVRAIGEISLVGLGMAPGKARVVGNRVLGRTDATD